MDSVQYSDAPLGTVVIDTLTSSRFLLPHERRLPFRDVIGRVNIHLVENSLATYDPFVDGAAVGAKLLQWQRHARRALDARPADEKVTLDEVAAGIKEKEKPTPPPPSAAIAGSPVRAARRAEVESRPKTVARKQQRRLFRAPSPSDEPSIDRHYLSLIASRRRPSRHTSKRSSRKLRRLEEPSDDEEEDEAEQDDMDEKKSGAVESDGSDDEDDEEEDASDGESEDADSAASGSGPSSDVYEVEAVLDEDELGTRGFLIRWAGYGSEHDSWEPEDNVAPQLVDDFREARRLMRNHQGTDYKHGNTRMLWCAGCCTHMPADSFSSNMRRAAPAARKCLKHHYKLGGLSATTTPVKAERKRGRDDDEPQSAPPAPLKRAVAAVRPVARSLNHRQASMEVQRARLFGF